MWAYLLFVCFCFFSFTFILNNPKLKPKSFKLKQTKKSEEKAFDVKMLLWL